MRIICNLIIFYLLIVSVIFTNNLKIFTTNEIIQGKILTLTNNQYCISSDNKIVYIDGNNIFGFKQYKNKFNNTLTKYPSLNKKVFFSTQLHYYPYYFHLSTGVHYFVTDIFSIKHELEYFIKNYYEASFFYKNNALQLSFPTKIYFPYLEACYSIDLSFSKHNKYKYFQNLILKLTFAPVSFRYKKVLFSIIKFNRVTRLIPSVYRFNCLSSELEFQFGK